MTLRSMKRGGLRGQLEAHLYDAILKGALRPGERIVEAKLARQLSVAQGSIREALQVLEYQGLVTKHDRRGTFVTELTKNELEDIYVLRFQLEPMAAELASRKSSPEQIRQVLSLVDKMQVAGERHRYGRTAKDRSRVSPNDLEAVRQ